MTLYQEIGDKHLSAWVHMCTGVMSLHEQRWQEAYTRFTESLALYKECGKRRELAAAVAGCLIGLAGISEGQGQPEQAAQLLGVAKLGLETIYTTSILYLETVIVHTEYDRVVTAVRNVLGKKAFKVAAAKGREMTLDEAIAFAREGQPQEMASGI
jgi:hypothetical protein